MSDENVLEALRQYPISGVRFNVIRRPLSGGEGTIVRHKATQGSKCPKCKGTGKKTATINGWGGVVHCPKCGGKGRTGGKPEETKDAYYQRLGGIITARPETYFLRWNIEVSAADVRRFETQTMIPILESLCLWWEWVSTATQDKLFANPIHYRTPYVYNPALEDGVGDLDYLMDRQSTAGLQRVTNLFPELT